MKYTSDSHTHWSLNYCPTAFLISRLLFNISWNSLVHNHIAFITSKFSPKLLLNILYLPLLLSQLTNDNPSDLENTCYTSLFKENLHFLQYFPGHSVHVVHISALESKKLRCTLESPEKYPGVGPRNLGVLHTLKVQLRPSSLASEPPSCMSFSSLLLFPNMFLLIF